MKKTQFPAILMGLADICIVYLQPTGLLLVLTKTTRKLRYYFGKNFGHIFLPGRSWKVTLFLVPELFLKPILTLTRSKLY